jgi:hypothetical protein
MDSKLPASLSLSSPYPTAMEYDPERPSVDYQHNMMPLAQTGLAMIDNDDDDDDNDDRFQDEYLTKANNGRTSSSSSSPPDYATATATAHAMSASNGVVVLTSSDLALPPTATTTTTTTTTTTAATSRMEKTDWVNATERTGHSCCGCCCDMRRAVIIINAINSVFVVLMALLFGLFTTDKAVEASMEVYDDDVTLNELQITMDLTGRDKFVIYLFFAFLLSLLTMGILGARYFKSWMVGIPGILYCVNAVFCLILGGWIPAMIAGLYAYPHVLLILEIQRGSMSTERYAMEQQSCCCV